METSDTELTQAYESEATARAIRDTRNAAIAASVAFPLFFVLDYIIYPEFRLVFLFLRAAVVFSSMLVYLLTRTIVTKHHAQLLGMVEYLVCAAAIVVMVHKTGGYTSPYYAGINLILIVFLFMLPLDVKRTSIICATIYSAYLIPILLMQRIENVSIFLNNNFFLLSTMVLVVISSHLASKMRRHEFSSRYRLARANRDLKALDELKTQFFANVSHEVRTPLTSIVSPIQSLYHGDAGSLSESQHELIAQVYRNSLRLLDMINQMLDFSRYEAKKMQLRLSMVDVDQFCSDIVSVFRELAERKGVILEHVRSEPSPTAYLDVEKLERILTNLVRNALKFTDEGRISISTSSTEENVIFVVEDTGIGIPDEHLPHIFERFRQVDGSSTRRYEGTGLGLTIVKEAVDLHHGSISVSSRVHSGTRFTVEIPTDLEVREPGAFVERREIERRRGDKAFAGPDRRRESRRRQDAAGISIENLVLAEMNTLVGDGSEKEPEETDVAVQSSADETIRVLYVEDNADLRSYVSRMLGRMGHSVDTATDGLDGWHKVRSTLPDIVVSDIMMPRLDGYDLIQYMREDDATRAIPVVLITAKPELDAKIQGLESGADDYLPKPVNLRELDARIRNLIHRKQLQAAEMRTHELEARMDELSMSFSQSLELRDSHTAGHSRDVLMLGSIIAEELKLPMNRVLKDSLLLHDIGKLAIPDGILKKPAPLDAAEWEIMRQHAAIGAQLLSRFDSFREVSEIVLAHQEHVDGSGYPRGLKHEEIPLFAGIISVADAFHAMTSDRPYRRALSYRDAIAELLAHRATQFEPIIVDAFLRGIVIKGIVTPADLVAARAAAHAGR